MKPSSSNVIPLAAPSRDDRRRALDQAARVVFVRAALRLPDGRFDLHGEAARCSASVDTIESWISGKRRVPGRALVAVGVVVDPVRKVAA